MTALSWIVKEAKSLRRKFPHRYDHLANPWRDGYIAQASAIYAKKHKGRSPVGKKRHKPHKLRRRIGQMKGGGSRKAVTPSNAVEYVRKKAGLPRKGIGSVSTRSRSHVDKNRITANIQVGALGKFSAHHLKSELKRRLNQKIDDAVVKKFHASKKRIKHKYQKTITHARIALRKLSA